MSRKPITVAINGFGRIGRTILRQLLAGNSRKDMAVRAINDVAALETCAYLFRFDSVFGPFPGSVETRGEEISINGQTVPFTGASDISTLDLSGVDVLLECTGAVSNREIADRGLRAGARNVLISGPSDGAEATIVLGANEGELGQARIVSNASCTTNAIAPLLRLIDDRFRIERGHVTTIHCYTGSQPMVDAPRDDLARSRAGALSMVPTSTSATRLLGQVLPQLRDRITGAAVRVPTASVSAIDATLQLTKPAGEDVVEILRGMAEHSPVLGWTAMPVVSSDLRGRPESLVIALPETMQADGHQVRVFGWYDNEWGFSSRMIDVARMMAARKF